MPIMILTNTKINTHIHTHEHTECSCFYTTVIPTTCGDKHCAHNRACVPKIQREPFLRHVIADLVTHPGLCLCLHVPYRTTPLSLSFHHTRNITGFQCLDYLNIHEHGFRRRHPACQWASAAKPDVCSLDLSLSPPLFKVWYIQFVTARETLLRAYCMRCLE